MSDAKYCNTCGVVFPADEEGCETGTAQVTRLIDGRRVKLDVVVDTCATCVAMRPSPQAVRVAIGSTRTDDYSGKFK